MSTLVTIDGKEYRKVDKLSTTLDKKVFNKLTVVKDSGLRLGKAVLWECNCECGKTKLVATSALTTGNTKSCGCLKVRYNARTTHNNKTFVHGTELGWLNSNPIKRNTSGRRGVSRGKGTKWRARITFQGVKYHLGTCETFDEAVVLREEAEKKYYTNFLEWYKETYGDIPKPQRTKKKKVV